ncbi:3-phosphoshikimate 1-carboxyvinyltransferase, partial [Actinotignum timonense]|nr:3-phosphoshikimate 1-carboxyvinyltransferase [Actinotignum timonense]
SAEAEALENLPQSEIRDALSALPEDHRMATFGAILGLRIPGLRVENIATTGKTMPRFAQMWTDLVGR